MANKKILNKKEKQESAYAMTAQGLTTRRIAMALKISRSTAAKWIKEEGAKAIQKQISEQPKKVAIRNEINHLRERLAVLESMV